jgi:hypothetical protein
MTLIVLVYNSLITGPLAEAGTETPDRVLDVNLVVHGSVRAKGGRQ